MKAETLKKSILQYAMQGKLVEQDPNDESASELLKRIKKEKEQLIKEGKIKKEKPLPSITKDEIPFELPKGWEWVRFKDICELYTGNSISEKIKKLKYTNIVNGYDYIGTKDISFSHNINYENGIKIPYDEPNFRYSYPNSILLCIEGGSAGKKIALVNKKVCFGNKLCSFNSFVLDFKYLYYYMQSPIFTNIFIDSKSGIIGGVGIAKLKELYCALPPLREQKRIVEKLEQILPLVEEYGKNEEKLSDLNKTLPDKIKQSILQYAIQGKLVPQSPKDEPASELLKRIKKEKEQLIQEGKIKKEKPIVQIAQDEMPFGIPNSWIWCRLSQITSIIGDGIHGTPNYTHNTKFYFINGNNLSDGIIEIKDSTKTVSETEYLKYKKHLTERTVLVSINGTLGNVAFYNNEKVMLGKSACYFNLLSEINKLYIKLVLNSDYFLKYADNKATGTTIKNVSLKAMQDLLIPLPPLAEQQRIVERVEKLLSIVDKLKV